VRVLAQDRLDAGDRIALTLKVYQRAADVLVTGSARLSAFHAGGDSLMGRYFSYRMHPLSVAELARPELGPPPGERAPAAVDDDAFGALIEFGGFPEPLQRQDRRFANRWRRLRHQQLFREELRDLTRIQETAKVQTLAQLVIQRAGQLTSYSSLAAAVGATVDSVRRGSWSRPSSRSGRVCRRASSTSGARPAPTSPCRWCSTFPSSTATASR
jgi:predicted AAA+ superfamily ATPase